MFLPRRHQYILRSSSVFTGHFYPRLLLLLFIIHRVLLCSSAWPGTLCLPRDLGLQKWVFSHLTFEFILIRLGLPSGESTYLPSDSGLLRLETLSHTPPQVSPPRTESFLKLDPESPPLNWIFSSLRNQVSCFCTQEHLPDQCPIHSLVFEAPGDLAPKAEHLARTGPERLPEGLNFCLLAGKENEKAARCEEGGPTWWVAAKGCSGVGAGPFICPLRRSPLPKGG